MNNFETQLKIDDKKETILNGWDKKILLEGSKNIVDKIVKEFRGRLPDGIIYPDESARPLHYLFNEIFEKIAKEHNIKKPRTFFMKTGKPDPLTTIFEDDEGRELYFDEVKEKIDEQAKSDEVSPLLNDYLMNKFVDTHIKREREQKRAREIEEYNEKLSDRGIIANLAVIDEFSNQGHTSKEINYAFGYDVPYFSVFGNKDKSVNAISVENIGLVIDTENYPENPITHNPTKLSYAVHPFKKSIGINKNNIYNKYSEINQDQTVEDKKKMETLRKEMGEIGREIAREY